MKKYKEIKSEKITENDLRSIDFSNVIYVEAGGRMGISGTMIYELKDGRLTLYRTSPFVNERLDDTARKLFKKIRTSDFSSYYGGFGNYPLVRNDIALTPAKEDCFWTFDFNGDQYRLDASVKGVFMNATEAMQSNRKEDVKVWLKTLSR